MKTFGLFLATCFMLHVNQATAQVTTFNLSGILSNAEFSARIARSNADARAEYRRQHLTPSDLEWMSNAMRNMKPPPPWPDASKKQAIFGHCAEVLRSAIDTNQVEVALDIRLMQVWTASGGTCRTSM